MPSRCKYLTNYPECSQNLRVQKSGKSLADVLMVLQELRITCLSALKRGKIAARRRHYQTAALPCQLPTTQHQQTHIFWACAEREPKSKVLTCRFLFKQLAAVCSGSYRLSAHLLLLLHHPEVWVAGAWETQLKAV